MAGLRVGQAYGGVPPTWVRVVGVSPQILEHPTSICDTGVKVIFVQHHKNPFITPKALTGHFKLIRTQRKTLSLWLILGHLHQ